MLRKYIRDPLHVVNFDDLHVEEDVSYVVKPVRILDTKEQILRQGKIQLVKVEWRSGSHEELTWEREDMMRQKFPELFGGSGMCLFLL